MYSMLTISQQCTLKLCLALVLPIVEQELKRAASDRIENHWKLVKKEIEEINASLDEYERITKPTTEKSY